jgi:hypothetical protein
LFLFFFNLCSFSYFSEKLPLEYRISHNDVLVSYFKGKISQIFPFLHQFCRFLVSPIIRFFRCWFRHLCSLIYWFRFFTNSGNCLYWLHFFLYVFLICLHVTFLLYRTTSWITYFLFTYF